MRQFPVNDFFTQQPPARPAIEYTHDSWIQGVLVPFTQSVVTAVFSGLAIGSLASLLKINVSPWQAGFVAGSLAGLAGWLAYRNHWEWGITATIETLLQLDLDRNGIIGNQGIPQPESVRVELVKDPCHQEFIDLPYPEKLPQLASGIIEGKRQFAQSVWCGNGQLFTRPQFETLRAEMIRRGLAEWKHPAAPAQGVELTAAGRAIFRKMASRTDSPTLPSGEMD